MHVDAHYNIGNVLWRQRKTVEAIHHYSEALKIDPDYKEAHNNMCIILARSGRLEEAISHFSEALRIDPEDGEARNNLSFALHERAERDKTSSTTSDP